jgi:hypothetical protein
MVNLDDEGGISQEDVHHNHALSHSHPDKHDELVSCTLQICNVMVSSEDSCM